VKEHTKLGMMRKYLVLTLACILNGIAVSLFLNPNSLAPGGVTGLSVMLHAMTSISVGSWILLLNVPILILGIWKFGLRFLLSTLYCTLMTSVCTSLFAYFEPLTRDLLLAALAGGSLMAISLGLVFLEGSTTGGIDIIIKLLRRKFPYLKSSFLFLVSDSIIIFTSAFVFRNINIALYAAITAIATSFVLDLVLYGRDEAKLIYIISDASEVIAQRILNELKVGVTYIEGFGAYQHKNKRVILCAVRKQLSYKVEAIVRESDLQAFLIITRAQEIFGQGYKSYQNNVLM
jgi:uncharacterized membrane-anchored protein YitT (DUF2179 family)